MSYYEDSKNILALPRDVSSSDRLVLLALATYANPVAFPAQARLARDTGLSRRGVQRIMDRLEARGLIVRVHRGGDRRGDVGAWTLLIPARTVQPELSTTTLDSARKGDPGSTMGDPGYTEGRPWVAQVRKKKKEQRGLLSTEHSTECRCGATGWVTSPDGAGVIRCGGPDLLDTAL